MIRLFFLLLLIPMTLFCRENPFFPVDSAQDIPLTTNQTPKIEPLRRATMTLSSTARVLESVTVTYKNLDGSIATKKIELGNAIDWHLPIFISQNYGSSPEIPKIKKKQTAKKAVLTEKFTKIASLPFITFYADAKKLKVVTKDKLLRSFLLVKPHRIVCDFKRETDIRSYVKSIKKPSLFKKIRVGTHKGYYRVVIELDGYYQYKVKKIQNGYLFTLL
ncbi:AMIN domain-containing protein [Sulfurimonas paralvinellae]|uniref:AMIN domain-containing protein n=1 Tax=Sulfurimonas paralvinellae TaxID=317658 RepID=A0A7M1B555_9BACT|nr:AMIN domain-containing protein [Sulfurimonas paralvinellae]QOP44863.1 AMIN domain-containing protein [Sulfurimonas paralvinellae]